jgi:hypothetical protein
MSLVQVQQEEPIQQKGTQQCVPFCFCRLHALLFAANLLFWIQIKHKNGSLGPIRVHVTDAQGTNGLALSLLIVFA